MKTIRVVLVALIAAVAFSSCTKEILPDPNPQTMDDLIVKADFSWKTSADYELTLQGPVNRVVSVMEQDGTLIKKCLVVANKPYKMDVTLPAYATTLRLQYNGVAVDLTLDSKKIVYSFK
jgi:hypothetical protein